MNKLINQKIHSPLSASQLLKCVEKGVRIYTYDELHKINNIDDILYPKNKVFILYMNTENEGHWTCLYVRNNDTLCFFDSYGGMVDNFKMMQYVDKEVILKKHQDKPYLAYLMLNSRYKKLDYNNYRLQGKNTSTCGRYCIMRLTFPNKTDEEFRDMLNGHEIHMKIEPDILVTILTYCLFDI